MTINLNAPVMTELKPRIVVVGVGGAGGNAVNNMILAGLEGVEFIVANTDSQALMQSQADRRIQLGAGITQGLGCGAQPDVGRAAAEEAIDQILDHMAGTHMAFITAGMGGGTGTGGAPVIAEALRNQGILTLGVVTKPFQFEGGQRLLAAERGIEELQSFVDTLIVIPNQNLFRIANEKTTFADAFSMADDVLHSGVRGITDLMVLPGLINLDFADVKTVMAEMGKAMMGTGEAEGEKRAIDAAEAAISNPLLDDVSMQGARGVLINITGGMDLTLYEVDEAANRVRQEVDPNANIIVGSALEDTLNGRMRVSVVATGIEIQEGEQRPIITTPRLAAVAGRPIVPESTSESPMPAFEKEDKTQSESVSGGPEEAASANDPFAADLATPIETELSPDLPLAFGKSVPVPKPPQAEPDPLTKKATADVSVEDKPFIAPLANIPEKDSVPLDRPDAMAEAEAVNPTDRPAKRKRGGFSLFRRKAPLPTPEAKRAVPGTRLGLDANMPDNTSQAIPTDTMSGGSLETQSVSAPNEFAPKEASDSADPIPAQPLAPLKGEEDLLEIPSFLRRQAN